MKLYSYFRSSASWRVRIALGYKGLPYTYAAVSLPAGEQRAPSFQEKNPLGTVPTLELDWNGHTERIGQSLAIIEFLEETHPEPPLLPRDPLLRARVRQIAETCNSSIQPLHNLIVVQEITRIGGDQKAWARKFIERGLDALDATLAPLAGRYCVGDQITLADVCLVPQLGGARRFELDPATRWPRLARIEEACLSHACFTDAQPDRQPDAT